MRLSMSIFRSPRLAAASVAVGFLVAVPARAAPPAAESGACSLENAAPATIAAIDDDFSLLLDDGRRAALSGLEFPPPPEAKEAKAAAAAETPARPDLRGAAYRRLSSWLVGRDVFVGALAPGTDRWGRAPARVYAAAGDAADAPLVPVGATLLEEGLARFRPDPPAASCAADDRAAETVARDGGRGVWADPTLQPVAAGEASAAALLRRKGMIVLEGKIIGVGESKGAIYLNFGQKRADNVSVVVLRRNLAILLSAGIDPLALAGRSVRVRGLVETAFGPRIEISSPAEIEILGPAAP